MLRRLIVLVPLAVALAFVLRREANDRGLLWRVVEACELDHRIAGAAFPCLLVDTRDGVARGYAVLRSPLERVHVVVTPTARTIGIEAPRLRGADAPNYFHDGWNARHFVTDTFPATGAGGPGKAPDRADLAMAVNSRVGRSQDQLHIHIACIRTEVRQTLTRDAAAIRAGTWTRVSVFPTGPVYRAQFVESEDLAGINVIDMAAEGLAAKPSLMHDLTIVVVGTEAISPAAPAGFVILARLKMRHGFDVAHGEALLDHRCARFRTPRGP